MKIDFEDGSYVELVPSSPRKFMLTILAKDPRVAGKVVANSVEITDKQLEELVKAAK